MPSWLAALLAASLYAPTVIGAGFAAMASPPRFELKGNPGDIIRENLEINNTDDFPGSYTIRTADWELNASGGVFIHPPELQPDSCRPWARIERSRLRLPGKGSRRYRFEIHIPADAPSGECRFALLLEAAEDEEAIMAKAGNVQFPVHGRIAVIVYLTVGDAQPKLSLEGMELREFQGRPTPVVLMRNSGNAHGRPSGILDVTDAMGRKMEFNVSPLPVLPGETRLILITLASPEGEAPVDYMAPLELKGLIEWEGGNQKVDTILGIPPAPHTDSKTAPEKRP